MKGLKRSTLGAAFALALTTLGLGAASAAAAPAWELEVKAPNRSPAGSTFKYSITPRNVGTDPTDGKGALDIVLPAGVKGISSDANSFLWTCDDPVGATTIHCDLGESFALPVNPGEEVLTSPIALEVEVDSTASGVHDAEFQMSGGGVPDAAKVIRPLNISTTPAFGITRWDGHIPPDEDGELLAGSHPYEIVTNLDFTTGEIEGYLSPDWAIRNVTVDLPAGFAGRPPAIPKCELGDLSPTDYLPLPNVAGAGVIPACSPSTIVGTIAVKLAGVGGQDGILTVPMFNMVPPADEPARFGFNVLGFVQQLTADARTDGDLGIQVLAKPISQGLAFYGAKTTFWGVPSDPSHDSQRCQFFAAGGETDRCEGTPGDVVQGPNPAPSESPEPFLTLPTSCNAAGEGMRFDIFADTWLAPHLSDSASFVTTKNPPLDNSPLGITGCDRVPFQPKITIQPTTDEAETTTGLEVVLSVPTDGLDNPTGIAQSHLKDAKVTLPDGMSVNPSYADGVTYCSPAQIGLVSANSPQIRFNKEPSRCPDASQLADVRIDTPLLEEPVLGAAYIAQQNDPRTPGAENPFDSTLGLYIVAEGSGVLVKLAGKVSPDQRTGQVVTTFLNNPQLPFERFSLKFKGGQRAPLSTPPVCGSFAATAELAPWARPNDPVTVSSSFNITKGPHGGPCPNGKLPPFKPGLIAGTLNNAAGTYSPFNIRLSREDGEQEFTRFSIKLPPGIVGNLSGIPFCSDAALATVKSKSGAEELATPSCPAASEVGRTEVGAGVGSLQVFAPGKLYLAGPYNGSALSIAAITAAKVGPFDLGTVLVRQALKVDPETAEVFIDSTGSDPIPHIIDGIVVHARDIRAFVDKPNFTLNPTSCERTSTALTALGSGLDFASAIDDNPITVTSPFQAADCAALPFKPRLSLRLIGGTKRGDHPKLRAHLKMAGIGEAAIRRARVALPPSEYLENANIKTICTRVQFNKGPVPGEQCPANSVYGHAKAVTPILDEPLTGPVFLRSSEHELPDLVAALHSGKINVNVIGRIDSEKDGGLRNTFEAVPDAPVSEFTLTMQGAKKGLLVNSTNLCKRVYRAKASFTAHNGKVSNSRPAMKVKCKGKKRSRAR